MNELAAEALGVVIPEPVGDGDLERRVQEAVASYRRTVVALDDDPTGVQTVHDTAVLASWSQGALAAELHRGSPLFFVLTNSRSLPESRAAELNREIARNLLAVSGENGQPFAVVSRSDSTLRGHFPAEAHALGEVLGGIDGVLICPAFFEGGRVTAGNVHFVREGERLVPAAATEFARDATFGYRARTLPQWVEEKTGGRTRASDVAAVTLDDVRRGGPERVAEVLRGARSGQPVVVNALEYPDLWVLALGLLQVEAEGKRFLYRTGASFVRARAGIMAKPLLGRNELLGTVVTRARGIVIVGSHVRKSSEQLQRLLELDAVAGVEVDVPALLAGESEFAREADRVRGTADELLAAGTTPAIFTSRRVERPAGMDELTVARTVSDALVKIVQGIETQPDFVIGKGGITSSDIGTRGLGAERAMVLGQVRPGVPVWRLGPESRFPRLPYVVFPGNVGDRETLAEIVADLIGICPDR